MGDLILWSATSDGRSWEAIVASIESKGRKVSDTAKTVIAKKFEATTGVTYNFVGIRGDEFRTDRDRTTNKVFAEADRRTYRKPTVEAGLLLWEKYGLDELGARYVAIFHEPVRDADDCPRVLECIRYGSEVWLDAWRASPGRVWRREFLFLFLQVSQS